MKDEKTKKIFLSGGGTGGSVTPVLTVAEALRKKGGFEFLFVGGKKGIEKKMAFDESFVFKGIFSGKLRRYFSWKNFIDPIFIALGFFESLLLVIKEKPELVITAGSFISVPLVWAAWFFKVPVLILQLDVRPGLANKLMVPAAEKVAVTFEKSLLSYGDKAIWTGPPFQTTNIKERMSKEEVLEKYGLNKNYPLILVMGGGTGASAINDLIKVSIEELSKICNIIHIAGSNKKNELEYENYRQFGFLDHKELIDIMEISDAVVSRAGLGTIIEIVDLGRPAIIIPMPGTHQEDNAKALIDAGAAIVLEENEMIKENFIYNIKLLLSEKELSDDLSEKVGDFMKRGGTKNILKIIDGILKK